MVRIHCAPERSRQPNLCPPYARHASDLEQGCMKRPISEFNLVNLVGFALFAEL